MTTSIGNNIKKIRELKNLSQEFMASCLNVSQGTYSNLENGKTRLSKARVDKIAGILGVNPSLLYRFDENTLWGKVANIFVAGVHVGHAWA